MLDCSIATILTVFRKPEALQVQIDAVRKQTISSKIFIWDNSDGWLGEVLKTITDPDEIMILNQGQNKGVWPRFWVCSELDFEYFSVLDDDTIPGIRWYENCLSVLGSGNCLLGTRGIRFLSGESYGRNEEFGWSAPNSDVAMVDLVGHAWFFPKSLALEFHNQSADFSSVTNTSGEDFHIAFSAQKANMPVLVPPHPSENPEMWGSNPCYGKKFGIHRESISLHPDSLRLFTRCLKHYVRRGWKLYNLDCLSRRTIADSLREYPVLRSIKTRLARILGLSNR